MKDKKYIYIIEDRTQNHGDTGFRAGSGRVGYSLSGLLLPKYAKYIFSSNEKIDSITIGLLETFPEKIKNYFLSKGLDYFSIERYNRKNQTSLLKVIQFYKLHSECNLVNEEEPLEYFIKIISERNEYFNGIYDSDFENALPNGYEVPTIGTQFIMITNKTRNKGDLLYAYIANDNAALEGTAAPKPESHYIIGEIQ